MEKHSGISLSLLLILAFVLFGTLATGFTRHTIQQRQQEVVSRLGLQEAERSAKQIHEHLYSVMRKGWSRQEVDDILARIGEVYPDTRIHLVRAEAVAGQYGDDPASAGARSQDAASRDALKSGKPYFSEHEGIARFIMPMANQAECLGCHSNPEGSVNGLIDIRIQTAKLRAPIEATLKPILNLVTLVIAGVFLFIFLLLRQQIVRPIVALSKHVAALKTNIDSGPRIDVGIAWPTEIKLLASEFNHLADEVRDTHRHLTELSVRDKLTGLYNRRYVDEMLARIIDQAERQKQPLSLLMLDLDGFKPINDKHGHSMGDTVLADVAGKIKELTRDGDICGRIGGDEFIIIAVSSDHDGADILAERLRREIGAMRWMPDERGQSIHVGVSIGVADYPSHARTMDALLDYADSAMYLNKRSARTA